MLQALTSWASGADAALVSPWGHPGQWVGPQTAGPDRALVVVGDDVRALLLAEAVGGKAAIAPLDRQARDQALLAPPRGPAIVTTSIDSLHDPTLRGALSQRLAGVPVCLWGADAWQPEAPAHRGRGAWVRLLDGLGLGPRLTVWRDPRGREGVHEGDAGVLRAASGQAFVDEAARASRGVLWPGAALEHRLGEAGQGSRTHDLRGLRPRAWASLARALRKEASGLELLERPAGALPGRFGAARTVAGLADLLVPEGGALLAEAAVAAPATTSAALHQAARPSGAWLVFPGGDADALQDAVDAGLLADLRPTLLGARLADARRFRSPFVDREPDHRRLHAAYSEALSGWSLAERARLALTDNGDRDLVELADALACEPAWLSDVLASLDRDGIVAVEVKPLAGVVDWQAKPGPAWADGDDGALQAVAARREAAAAAARAVLDADGSRLVALRRALGLGDGDVADEAGSDPDWRWKQARGGADPLAGAGFFDSLRTDPKAAAEALFGAPKAGPSARDRLEAATPGELPTVVADVGGAGAALAALCLTLRRPHGPSTALPEDLITPTLLALAASASPGGLAKDAVPGFRARWVRDGLLELHGRGGRWAGAQRISIAGTLDDWLRRLAPLDPSMGLLGADRQASAAWPGTFAAGLEQLRDALRADGGLPSAEALAAPHRLSDSPTWSAVAAAWNEGAEAELPPSLAEADAVATLAAARRGDWAAVRASKLRGEPWDELRSRAVLGLEPPPALSPGELAAWLAKAPPPQADFDRLLAHAAPGQRDGWMALVQAAGRLRWPADPVVQRAIALGRLPGRLRDLLLPGLLGAGQGEAAARLLAASADDATELLAALRGAVAKHGVQALLGLPGDGILAEAQGQLRALVDRGAELRAQALADAADGRLADAASALLELGRKGLRGPGWGGEALAPVEQQVAAAQQRYTAPLAAAFAGGDEQAAQQALEAATADGWLEPLTAVLRAQARRHGGDPTRRLWLARALAAGGHWPQARQELDLADLAPEAHREAALPLIEAALGADASEFAVRWLSDLARGRPSRSLGRAIAMLAWGGKLPADARAGLIEALESQGTGIYAGALRALHGQR